MRGIELETKVLLIAMFLVMVVMWLFIMAMVWGPAAGQEFGREVQFLPLVSHGWSGVPTPNAMPLPTWAPTMPVCPCPCPIYPTPNPTPTSDGGE